MHYDSQAAAMREAEISRIEQLAAHFRDSGACDEWFKQTDPLIAKAISSLSEVVHISTKILFYRQPAASMAHC